MDSETTSCLDIRLLGTSEILLSGKALNLNNFKARALLFYLAATGRPHSRDFLATLLWTETPSHEAHHSLRSCVYRLRRALGSEQANIIVSSGEFLSLQSEKYQCDVIDFRHLAAAGDELSLKQAVELFQGSFLQGFSLADALAFDEWAQVEQASLSQICLDALDHLSAWSEKRADWSAATRYLQQMSRLDPLAENVQQRLMWTYLRRKEVGLALRQYRQYETLLAQELHLAPSPETLTIYHEILQQQHGSVSVILPGLHPSRLRSDALPFCGRDHFLEQLLTISQNAKSGQGMTILLQGEAGIGKSRLLDELVSRLVAEPTPWIILQGACTPFDDLLSHGPFLEALQNVSSGDLFSDSASAVPDARGRFFWNILQTIRSSSQAGPLLLAIEDLQWANGSTLNLFGFLASRLYYLPVVLLGTVQRAEAIPALQRLISLGRRRGELHLMSLTPLAIESVSELIHASGINSSSDETLAEWLHSRSDGNPFLLAEIMAQLRKDGIIKPTADHWQLDITHWLRWKTTFKLPETTHDLVAWRLADLSIQARHLLDVLAVASQPLPFDILCGLPDVDRDLLITLIDDLAARGLIVEAPNAAIGLPHHLLRETLLHHLNSLRRRTTHRQLAQALDAYTDLVPAAQLRQIAMHAVAGEDVGRARRFGLRVLSDLPLEYSGAETLDFVHHLYDLLTPSASNSEMVLLTCALGGLHQGLGQLEMAAYWYHQNLEWAQKSGDIVAQAEAWFEMGELALMSNDYHTAARTARDGLTKSESIHLNNPLSIGTLIGRGHRLLGAALAMEGSNLDAAESELQKAVLEQRRTGNQGDLCAGLFELGNISAQRGELRAALKLYDESAQAAESGSIYYYLALARNNFAYHSLLLGDVGAAQQAATQGLKIAEAYELLAALLHLYSTQGEIYLYLGEWGQAEEFFQRGLVLADELGSLERQAGYRGGLALAARRRNEPESAITLLKEALALIADQGYWHLRARLQLSLAEIFFDQDRFAETGQLLVEAVVIAQAHQRALLLVQARRLQARLLAALGDWPAANDLFAKTLESAVSLGLALEIARVQAAWGENMLKHSAVSVAGRELITLAQAVFVDLNAHSDLVALPQI
jgi:DNA-binding SARP family transcriptional activator/predicted ATPase